MKDHGPLSDAQYQDRLRSIERRRSRQVDDDLRALMSAEWGRRLAYWLVFELGSIHEQSFAADKKYCVGEHSAFNDGWKAMARKFHALIQGQSSEAVVSYIQMIDEQCRARLSDLQLAEAATEAAKETSE